MAEFVGWLPSALHSWLAESDEYGAGCAIVASGPELAVSDSALDLGSHR